MGYAGFPGQTTTTAQYVLPMVVGFTYNSQGQRLRDIAPDASGARNGPALGKTRRNHRFGSLMANTIGISFGVDFAASLQPARFMHPGDIPYTALEMWTGVYTDTITDDNSLDGMLSWQISRPYPATVNAVEGFLHTQDR